MSSIVAAMTAIFLLIAAASSLQAQSLGDTARREEERRKSVKPAGKVITNADLPAPLPVTAAPPTTSGSSTSADASSAGAGTPDDKSGVSAKSDASGSDSATTVAKEAKAGKADKAENDGKSDKADGPKDEKYWRDRLKQAQEGIARDRTYAEALQTRINALTTDFVNRDDPAQRAVITADRQKAVTELDRLKKSIADQTKALADLEDEARRAGVPPGWLRQ
jgi:hypothetical protein